MRALGGLLLLGTLIAACAGPGRGGSATSEGRGTVRYIDLEGGFYGIESDDGARLDPVNLPEEFRVDGARVRYWAVPAEGRASIHMWGTLVEIVEIRKE